MNGKFRTPIWVIPALALLLIIGAVATMTGISQFSAGPAEASSQEAGQGLTSDVDLEKLIAPPRAPVQATYAVTTGAAPANSVDPDTPGAATKVTVVFTATSGPLAPGTGLIVIRFSKDFQAPTVVDRNQITITADSLTNTSLTLSDAAAPQSVTIDFVGTEDQNPEITLTVPDMVAGDESGVSAGAQGIAAGAEVTVVFQQSAGFKNTPEGDNLEIEVETSADPGLVEVDTMDVPFIVQRDSDAEPRNKEITVVGLGFKNNTTATFWLDVNGNGVRDGSERDLCKTITDDNISTCTFTTQNPPFIPGDGADCAFASIAGGTFNCNYINVIDGVADTASQRTQEDIDRSRLTLRSTVEAAPKTANVGDKITISLFDFPTGHTIHKIQLGGVNILNTVAAVDTFAGQTATTPSLTTLTSGLDVIPTSGQESFTFEIPGNVGGVRIPTGTQRLRVRSILLGTDILGSGDQNRFTNITVGGANLTISHETVIGNQDLTISGNGFTEGGGVCIAEGGITLANVSLQIDDTNDCTTTILAAADVDPATSAQPERGILLTSGGTFTITVRIEQTDATMPTALLTEGTHELKVIDTKGAEGTLNVTIDTRTIEVTPAAARPRDIVTIIGKNFIADNADGLSSTVNVKYECGSSSRETTADTDVSGNFRETLRIPSNCAIPSTNTITATINAGGSPTGIVETVIHDIPDALVTISPSRGPSGTLVTVSGEGFRTFETVSKVEFGGLGTLGGRTENTDTNGDFSVTGVLVPGLDPGIHAVKVEVGSGTQRTTSSTSFEVLESGEVGVPTPLPEALDPLGDNLVRAFHFNNVTKVWTFYDPRPEFADANTLSELVSNAAYWVRIVADVTVDLNFIERNLSCVDDDCWNLLVY